MNSKHNFYQRIHNQRADYSGAVYNIDQLVTGPAFRQWLGRQNRKSISLLDIGCGKGFFFKDLVIKLESLNFPVTRIVGIDLVQSPGNIFSQFPGRFEFVEANIDGHPLPFPAATFNFVACNHILEHVFETELLLREVRRILAPSGLAVVSVPNIAAWINRLLFLAGSQPLGSEVGTEAVTYGFWPALAQRRLAQFKPAGHIRDFTPRALRDLCHSCGFDVAGWWNQSGTPFFPLTRWAGRMMGLLLTTR